jgi:hypothetical protein
VSVWWGASVCGAMPSGVIYISTCEWRKVVQNGNKNRSSGCGQWQSAMMKHMMIVIDAVAMIVYGNNDSDADSDINMIAAARSTAQHRTTYYSTAKYPVQYRTTQYSTAQQKHSKSNSK